MKSKTRKFAGRIKKYLIDTLPYARQQKAIPRYREQLKEFTDSLQPLGYDKDSSDLEVHMLCGKRDLRMGIVASWSLLRFCGPNSELFVHSDGSLNEEHISEWRRVVPNFTLIEKVDADSTIAQNLEAEATLLYEWRCSNWASAQLTDVHFYGSSPSLVVMDSDVLVFQKPKELLTASVEPTPAFRWCRGISNSYSAEPQLLHTLTNKKVADALCAGFLLTPRISLQELFELNSDIEKLSQSNQIDTNHFWSCQTYYSFLASAYQNSKPLPEKYNNHMGRTKDEPLRHYVGIPSIRYRYYTEGINILRSQLDR